MYRGLKCVKKLWLWSYRASVLYELGESGRVRVLHVIRFGYQVSAELLVPEIYKFIIKVNNINLYKLDTHNRLSLSENETHIPFFQKIATCLILKNTKISPPLLLYLVLFFVEASKHVFT